MQARLPFWICSAAYYLVDSVNYRFDMEPKEVWDLINLLTSAPKSRDADAIASIYSNYSIMERIAPTAELVAYAQFTPSACSSNGDQLISSLLEWPLSEYDRTLLRATLFLKNTRSSESIIIVPDKKVKAATEIPAWLCDARSPVGRAALATAGRHFGIDEMVLRLIWRLFSEEATVNARWVVGDRPNPQPTDNVLWPLYVQHACSVVGIPIKEARKKWDSEIYPFIKKQIEALVKEE
jgi:hypothetical protein